MTDAPPRARTTASTSPVATTEPALRGLFDHAGMFPPAQLSLEAALSDAAGFLRTLRRPGLVGADLVVAWKDWPRLDEAALRKAGFAGRPCRVALVGLTPDDMGALGADVVRRATAGKSSVQVVSIEVHLDAPDEKALLDGLSAWRTEVLGGMATTYVEPRMPPDKLAPFLPRLAKMLGRGKGLKLRCAGPHAVDRATLAKAIAAAASARIPFKLTQGLHHPVPRPGFPHGFLNVLAAVRLRQALGEAFGPEIHACLAEDDVKAFSLRDGISWRGFHVAAARIAELPPFAIGSCSLMEPDDDLVAAYGRPGGP